MRKWTDLCLISGNLPVWEVAVFVPFVKSEHGTLTNV